MVPNSSEETVPSTWPAAKHLVSRPRPRPVLSCRVKLEGKGQEGRTVALDNVTLTSPRLGLVGRPDRLVKSGGLGAAEEWKSSQSPRAWHRALLGVYFLLLEEETGVRPSRGVLVLWQALADRGSAAGNRLNGIVSGRPRRLRERQRRVGPLDTTLLHFPGQTPRSPARHGPAVSGPAGRVRRRASW